MSWFVGIVAPHGHRIVERQLAQLGYPAFYPRLKRWVVHARKKVAVERPLLGRYVFVEINDLEFDRCGRIERLHSFLVNGRGPQIIPDELVYDWRHRYMLGEFDLTSRHFPLGALVRISEGEFAEQIAVVTGNQRGKISVRPTGSTKVIALQFRLVSAA